VYPDKRPGLCAGTQKTYLQKMNRVFRAVNFFIKWSVFANGAKAPDCPRRRARYDDPARGRDRRGRGAARSTQEMTLKSGEIPLKQERSNVVPFPPP
jgi:hypothetical protein